MKVDQSCGRTGLVDIDPHSLHESTHVFQYCPLDPDVDRIRLAVIEPSMERKAPVHCKLRRVTFARKLKYEALSYMWGDESKKKGTVVDGKEFLIGVLLLGALQDLRDIVNEKAFGLMRSVSISEIFRKG